MAFSTKATTGEGSKVAYETTPGGGTYADLNFARDLPELGEQGTFIDMTPIKTINQVFEAGGTETQEIELVLFDVPGDTDHEAYITKAKARETVSHQFTYTTGRIGTVELVLNGSRVNPPARGEGVTITVYAQQRGAVVWSEA